MELCFMKSHALDTLKDGLPRTYENYFTQRDNSWLSDICGENPFQKFRDVPDFELAPLDTDFEPSKVDFDNCKILYRNLHFLTPRQAADEKFWAGLCHGTFYDYVRRRWGYDKAGNLSGTDNAKILKGIKNRFFFDGRARERILTNTLAKYWWTGYIFPREALEILGAKDFYTKIFSILSRAFIGNKNLRSGFVKFLRHFKDRGITLDIKNHIRPAMTELNKCGGAVVLDCLDADEIAAIMIDYVEKNFPQKFIFETRTAKFIPIVNVDTRTIKFGDKIKITSLDGGKTRTIKIGSPLKRNCPDIFDELIGQKINSTVTIRDEKFKITDVT